MKSHGMKYVYLGRELGGRSNDPSCYEDGRVQYARLARAERFRVGIERVVRGAREHRIALMCVEKDPLECHRCLLVGRALDDIGVHVEHILSDGRLETNDDAMNRLLGVVGLPLEDLFRSKKELIAQAISRQESRVAHVNHAMVAGVVGRSK